jgi:hypothetical protein
MKEHPELATAMLAMPVSRSVQRAGVINSSAVLVGLHHHYGRS